MKLIHTLSLIALVALTYFLSLQLWRGFIRVIQSNQKIEWQGKKGEPHEWHVLTSNSRIVLGLREDGVVVWRKVEEK